MLNTEPQTTNTPESRQEQLTQEYDNFLTKTEDLENNPNVSIDEFTTTSGKKVKRYNLAGADFAFLSHTVGLNINNVNLTTSKDINENINTWDKVKKNEANNQISCSLITNDHISHPTSKVQTPKLLLGFNHLENGELFAANAGDLGTDVDSTFKKMNESRTYPPEQILQTAKNGLIYNEVLISRYHQNEQPRQPDFIITFDGQITKQIEQAVDYFNVPIVNLQTNEYIKIHSQKINSILNEINPNTPLEQQKELFSQIPYLYNNQQKWEGYSSETHNECWSIRNRINEVESSLIEQQLSYDQNAANIAIKKFKANQDYQSLREIKSIFHKIYYSAHGTDEQENLLFQANPKLEDKFYKNSHQTISQGVISITPEIINFYQEQITKLSKKTDSLSIAQLKQELNNFKQSSLIVEIDGQPMLHTRYSDNSGLDIGNSYNQDKNIELIKSLNQILLTERQLEGTFESQIKESKQRDIQEQIKLQTVTLEAISSDFNQMIDLLKNNHKNHEFSSQILTKIKEYLAKNPKETVKIITSFRNHQEILKTYPELTYKAFGDGYDNEICRLLTNTDRTPIIPQKITLSDTTIIDDLNRESKIVSFIDSNRQSQLFAIYPKIGPSKSLETPNNKPTQDVINSLNKKWFWRLIKHLPKFEISNTYQLNPESTKQLLVTTETDFYLINNQAVQKIKMSKFNIETNLSK